MLHTLRSLRLAALAGTLCLLPAYPSTITFLASGSFENGAVLSGTVAIDTATGTALSGDLAVSGVPAAFTTLQGQSTGPQPSPIFSELDFTNGQATNNRLSLLFKPDSLVGYTGGPLCRFDSPDCIDPNNSNIFYVTLYGTVSSGIITDTSVLKSGALTSAAAEPPSLTLMSLALLALAWKGGRLRFNHSEHAPSAR